MPAEPPRPVERAPWAARAFFWAWIGAQVGLPALQLLPPAAATFAPRTFGWQMYARPLRSFEIWAVLPGGERHRIDLQAYVTVPREEIPWHEILPADLCPGLPRGTVIEAAAGGPWKGTLCR